MSGKPNEGEKDRQGFNPEYQDTDPDRQVLIRDLNADYGLEIAGYPSAGRLEESLSERLNRLIREDFSGLVRLLYRVDIDEARLKQLLHTGQGTDSGKIIARLIIERQLQKIRTRKIYAKNNPSGDCEANDSGDNRDGAERW